MSELEQLIAINLRTITWWALDEITEVINPKAPEKIRSALYRTFVREGINRVPEKEKEKAKRKGNEKEKTRKGKTARNASTKQNLLTTRDHQEQCQDEHLLSFVELPRKDPGQKRRGAKDPNSQQTAAHKQDPLPKR